MVLSLRRRARDRAADVRRLDALHVVLDGTIRDVEREFAGLAARTERARDRCASLLGTADLGGNARDATDEADLAAAEAQLMAGLRRLDDLSRLRRALLDTRSTLVSASAREGLGGGAAAACPGPHPLSAGLPGT